MPDSEDYATLDRLLRDPQGWTTDDLQYAKRLLTAQLDAARTYDQRDQRRVASMHAVAEQLAAAIEEHGSTQ